MNVRLTSADVKQNIPFPFAVPEGTRQLTVRVSFSPWVVDNRKNLLTLSLFDPNGWRGAGHRHGEKHEVMLSEHSATPGYRAGRIVAGDWTLVLDTHMIMPDSPLMLQIQVSGTDESAEQAPQALATPKMTSRGRGWYRGDLHAHTIHSDASWDIPDLLSWAKRSQL